MNIRGRLLRLILQVVTFIIAFVIHTRAATIQTGPGQQIKSINGALSIALPGDTIMVHKGLYMEGNIIIRKPVSIIGMGYPVIDGNYQHEVFSVKSSNVNISGLCIQHSGYASLSDPCGIKIYNCQNVTISGNKIYDNFFGIYAQYSQRCIIKNNTVIAHGKEEQQIGNGIHCWKSDSLQITGNYISGHRDGIYFEFVTHSLILRNKAVRNIRYGLHFMFSNNDDYISNYFTGNGAGVAVMFTKNVKMIHNTFEENWGDAAYGLLLKEISDSYIFGNHFTRNTSGIYMEGTSRITISRNRFDRNGWGMRIQASCMDNRVFSNNFTGNTFDITTNGTLVLNNFDGNYWDKYEGYDLNRDHKGDVPYHPISMFSIIVEQNPTAMLLFRSIIVTLLDKSEKLIPSLTPIDFRDNAPLMKALQL